MGVEQGNAVLIYTLCDKNLDFLTDLHDIALVRFELVAFCDGFPQRFSWAVMVSNCQYAMT